MNKKKKKCSVFSSQAVRGVLDGGGGGGYIVPACFHRIRPAHSQSINNQSNVCSPVTSSTPQPQTKHGKQDVTASCLDHGSGHMPANFFSTGSDGTTKPCSVSRPERTPARSHGRTWWEHTSLSGWKINNPPPDH